MTAKVKVLSKIDFLKYYQVTLNKQVVKSISHYLG